MQARLASHGQEASYATARRTTFVCAYDAPPSEWRSDSGAPGRYDGISCGYDGVSQKAPPFRETTACVTGMDYFGARYFSAAQGRFTSADQPMMDQHIEDPQSWNLYGRNNPLRFFEPTGQAVELLGDEEERKKELELLQRSMKNDDAASRLYINEVKEGDNTRYFVGITGDVKGFEKIAGTANDMGQLVENKKVIEFGLTSENLSRWGGAATFEPGEHGDNKNTRVLVNPAELANSLSSNTLAGVSRFEGQMENPAWVVKPLTDRTAAWHEFGHALGLINGTSMKQTNQEALDWENRMREQLYGPLGPYNARRKFH